MQNEIPIRLSMALSTNKKALIAFLNMEQNEQNRIIKEAEKITAQRQMEQFVNQMFLK